MAPRLPDLLAGPILRRTGRDGITLWLATRFDLEGVLPSVFRIKTSGGKYVGKTAIAGGGRSTTAPLGRNLFVTIVEATPRKGQTYPTGVLLGYDLTLVRKSGAVLNLELLLPEGLESICYGSFPVPTFYIPARNKAPLYFLHGSCRKPHGGGDDSLAAGDRLLENTVESVEAIRNPELTDLAGRPAILLLTGDQIYADDVDDTLLPSVTELAIALMGYEERIPSYSPEPQPYTEAQAERRVLAYQDGKRTEIYKKLKPVEAFRPRVKRRPDDFSLGETKLTDLKVGRRKRFVHTHAGFSTQDENHLLGFGEFAAMYLLVWNPEIWPSDKTFSRKVERLRTTLGRVRRLLANIAVYMIFDDHEITDDWNIDGTWVSNTTLAPGRRIIANGLGAYWAFQGWGNQPAAFGRKFRETVTDYVKHQSRNDGSTDFDVGIAFERQMIGFDDWVFATPTSPTIIFLDTRTQRDFKAAPLYRDQKHVAAKLIGNLALLKLFTTALNAGFKPGRDPLIMVSAAPVYGYGPAEYVQEEWLVPGRVPGKHGGRYTWDLESWRANREGFFNFITFVAERLRPSYCLFLSGDVHYGYTATVRHKQYKSYWGGSALAKQSMLKMPIVQLTSSALKNADSNTRDMIAKKLTKHFAFPADLPIRYYTEWPHPKDPKVLVFTNAEKWEPTIGTGPSPVTGESNLGYVTVHSFGRANIGITHTLLLYDERKYASNGGLANNSTLVPTGFF